MELGEEAIKKLIKAGKIAKTVREEAIRITKPGTRLLDIAEYIENRIRELGGEPAFPVNIGINETAAHYTPTIGDQLAIPENSIVKIDIGVHVDGYIADTATTVVLNPVYEGLAEAARKALEKAVEIIRPGISVREIGKVIEETIKSMGYRPIKNLSGHSIDRFIIHSGLSIPNYNDVFNRSKITDGIYAIEPFASTGIGLVIESKSITIYALTRITGKKLEPDEKILVEKIWNARRMLPFCERWYQRLYNNPDVLRKILSNLLKKRVMRGYPVLIEKSRGYVSQFEHTIIVKGKDVIITTA